MYMTTKDDSQIMAVIGANGSIGTALVNELEGSGFTVAKGVRSQDQITTDQHFHVDASSWESIDGFFTEVEEKLGPIYGVALCVGSILLKPAHLTSEADFDNTLEINLKSAFGVVKAATGRMVRRGGGSVVLVSTAAARHGIPNHEAIAAAKAGVIGLSRSAAASYARQGVRINCVAPGLTNTHMASPIVNSEASLNASKAMHAMGKIGEPEDVASAIAWFMNPKQSWVTGQVLGVDGGLGDLMSRK